jgi:hypothetical protein
MGAIRSWLSLVIVAALAVSSGAAQPPSTEAFVTVNGVRLHYLDWGGNGRPLLFLTSLGSNAISSTRSRPSSSIAFVCSR